MRQAHLVASIMREQKSGGHSNGVDAGLQSASDKFNEVESNNARVAKMTEDFTGKLLEAMNKGVAIGEQIERLAGYAYTMKSISGYNHAARDHLYPEMDFMSGEKVDFEAVEIFVADQNGSRRAIATVYGRTDEDKDLMRKVKMAVYQMNRDMIGSVSVPGVNSKSEPS